MQFSEAQRIPDTKVGCRFFKQINPEVRFQRQILVIGDTFMTHNYTEAQHFKWRF